MKCHKEVRSFWRERACAGKGAPEVSTPAVHMMDMENRFVRKMLIRCLQPGSAVLDVGCANGYSTAAWSRDGLFQVLGVDACPEMIANAKERYGIDVVRGDMTDLPFAGCSFDAVVIKRALCNLQSHQEQDVALAECLRVLRSGGVCIVVDFISEGYHQLHTWRSRLGLRTDTSPWHNLPLMRHQLLSRGWNRYRLGGSCYLIGFVLYPWVAKQFRLGEPSHRCWVHAVAARLPALCHFGPLEAYVLRKGSRSGNR